MQHETVGHVGLAKPLAGKSAIVTGATSGIGLGIAKALAAEGADVLVNGLGVARDFEGLLEEIRRETHVRVAFSQANVAEPEEIVGMYEDAISAFGKVDILVNNAGIQHVEAVETFPVELWQKIIAVNLSAAFYATKAVVPGMKARHWGRIINIASAHALVASPFKSAYVAAKHGIVGLTKTVALETAEAGITVNALCPGYVLTPLVERQIPETALARGLSEDQVIRDVLLKSQPTRKFITTEEVGAFAVFLCSDAAGSITGSALPIEGGWTAQ